ncbi:hypothetical protein [Rubritalea profundi]|uniref:MBG domain-containing protein n=1 Tax=Rubritalea profundi TaxID=1658618 RepID=A0A2S7U125_9BACT|nr:hypothetical protein [Rubritalea profundi]PQJ28161.1 hypothetical protein BSZ32_06365 [Rubritalea profundi]
MKYIVTSLLLLSATIAFSGFSGFLTQKSQDWKFIQSVGGMKVSLEEKTLNVECYVSGLKKVTIKPTMINSAMGVRRIKHKRDGKTIYLTLVTSVIEKAMTQSCKQLDLSAYPAGEYSVQYRDPDGTKHPLGKITLKEQKKGE